MEELQQLPQSAVSAFLPNVDSIEIQRLNSTIYTCLNSPGSGPTFFCKGELINILPAGFNQEFFQESHMQDIDQFTHVLFKMMEFSFVLKRRSKAVMTAAIATALDFICAHGGEKAFKAYVENKINEYRQLDRKAALTHEMIPILEVYIDQNSNIDEEANQYAWQQTVYQKLLECTGRASSVCSMM